MTKLHRTDSEFDRTYFLLLLLLPVCTVCDISMISCICVLRDCMLVSLYDRTVRTNLGWAAISRKGIPECNVLPSHRTYRHLPQLDVTFLQGLKYCAVTHNMCSDNLWLCSDKGLFVQWQKFQELVATKNTINLPKCSHCILMFLVTRNWTEVANRLSWRFFLV